MNYGSILYENAVQAHLIYFDIVHHQALRWISRACKTTPIVALHAETKIPPLSLRRIHLTNE